VRWLAGGRGVAALAICHALNRASVFCDRVYALAEGRVVASGPPASVITRELLAEVYGVEADVTVGPATGRSSVTLTPPAATPWPGALLRAHVIGGAGRGAAVMRALTERGFAVTAGVVPDTDADPVAA